MKRAEPNVIAPRKNGNLPNHQQNSGSAVNTKPITRTAQGLRDALFDEMDLLRSGKSNPAQARSMSLLANSVIGALTAEIDYNRYIIETKTSADKTGSLPLGKSIDAEVTRR